MKLSESLLQKQKAKRFFYLCLKLDQKQYFHYIPEIFSL